MSDAAPNQRPKNRYFYETAILALLPFLLFVAYAFISLNYPGLLSDPKAQLFFLSTFLSLLFGVAHRFFIAKTSEIEDRQAKQDTTIAGLLADAHQSIETKATQVVSETEKQYGDKIDQRISTIGQRVNHIIEGNEWLRRVDPDYVALWSRSYDPIVIWAVHLLKRGEENALYQWLYFLAYPTKEPNRNVPEGPLTGSKDALIELWELITFALQDHALALQFVENELRNRPRMDMELLALRLYSNHKLSDNKSALAVARAMLAVGQLRRSYIRRLLVRLGILSTEEIMAHRKRWFVDIYQAEFWSDQGKDEVASGFLAAAKTKAFTAHDRSEVALAEAKLMYRLGKIDGAIARAEASVGLDGGNAEACYFLYRVLANNNQGGRADEIARVCIANAHKGSAKSIGGVRKLKLAQGQDIFSEVDEAVSAELGPASRNTFDPLREGLLSSSSDLGYPKAAFNIDGHRRALPNE